METKGPGTQSSSLEAGEAEQFEAYLEGLMASPGLSSSRRRSALLRYLVQHTLAGKADAITEYGIGLDVYRKPSSFDPHFDSLVRVDMSRLRRWLADYYSTAGQSDLWRIEFPSRGYVPTITRKRQESTAIARPARPLVWKWAAAGVVVVGTVLAWRAFPPRIRSAVVLPFENLTGDPNNEFLTDGITEQLTDALAQTPALRVVARTSAFQFKGKNMDVREIGRQLNADAVVEGSLQRTGGRFRLTVQVNRTTDGYHILSRSFEGAQSELDGLETGMILPVLDALTARGNPRSTTGGVDARSSPAYPLFLKGWALKAHRGVSDFDHAEEYFRAAIARDPEFAPAYTGLAESLILGTLYGGSAMSRLPKAKEAARKAQAIDSGSAQSHLCLGAVAALFDYDWPAAEREFQEALQLGPNEVEAHQWYALLVLAPHGRFAEAVDQLRIARSLDPLSAVPLVGQGLIHFFQRSYAPAIASYQQALAIDPTSLHAHFRLAQAYRQQGDFRQYLSESAIGDALVFGDSTNRPERPRAAAALSTSPAAYSAARLRDLLSGEPGGGAAFEAVSAGRPDIAIAQLHRCYDLREPILIWIAVEPEFDSLRRDPAFEEVVRLVGLR